MTWLEPELEDGADDWLRPELLLVPEPEPALELPDPALAPPEDEPDPTELREALELA